MDKALQEKVEAWAKLEFGVLHTDERLLRLLDLLRAEITAKEIGPDDFGVSSVGSYGVAADFCEEWVVPEKKDAAVEALDDEICYFLESVEIVWR